MKNYYNPKTRKMEGLFEELTPVFTVGCTNDNIVNGDKGSAVFITVEAKDEEEAKDKAILNHEFMSHIHNAEKFDRKFLSVHKPIGLYVINKVRYYDGDPRL